jgi:hypothetical protein
MRMNMTGWIAVVLAGGLLAGLVCACNKKEPAQAPSAKGLPLTNALSNPSNSTPVLARIHWIGKKSLADNTNASSLMTVWNLPESGRLEAQTLDKFALAPWLHSISNYLTITNYAAAVSNCPPAMLLRPLVEDLLQQEVYVEARAGTNESSFAALAVKLDPTRAALWQTNLPQVLLALSLSNQAELVMTGGWAIVSVEMAPLQARSDTNHGDRLKPGLHPELLTQFEEAIQKYGAPFPPQPSNNFFYANVDVKRLASSLGLNLRLPENWPIIDLLLSAEGSHVHTAADLLFGRPLNLQLDAWMIPTNLIHDPLIGFTAVRGIRQFVEKWKFWHDLNLGPAPNQAYFWAQTGPSWMHFMAAPSAGASNQVSRISDYILTSLNQRLSAQAPVVGNFDKATNYFGVAWHGVPVFSPTVEYVPGPNGGLLFAGFFNKTLTNTPVPSSLVQQVQAPTNLLFYDWEHTGRCMDGLTPMFQLTRRLFNRPRIGVSAGMSWFLAAKYQLGNSATVVKLLGPQQISLVRSSTAVFTGAEFEVLMDWLESPEFPRGLHTTTAPRTETGPSAATPTVPTKF